jgi:hypothetical protein
MPVLEEFASVLEDTEFQSAVFAGEMYAVRDDGRRMPLGEVSHHLKGRRVKTVAEDGVSWDITDLTPAEEGRVRLAVFDVLEIDESPVSDDYWKKILLLGELLDGTAKVHPVIARQGDADVIKDLWEHNILEDGLEGLVIHTNGLVKVKVLVDVEMVVVGMKADGEQYPRGLAGALLLAFVAKDGSFIFSTSVNCRQDRRQWFDYIKANQVGTATIGKSPYILCKPEKILSVQALAWNIHEKADLPGYAFENGQFVWKGLYQGAVAREPRFMLTDDEKHLLQRHDKSVNPYDLRVQQVPDYDVPPIEERKKDESVEERNRQKLAEMFGKNPPVPAPPLDFDFASEGDEWGFPEAKVKKKKKAEAKDVASPEDGDTLYSVEVDGKFLLGTIRFSDGGRIAVLTTNRQAEVGEPDRPFNIRLSERTPIFGEVKDGAGRTLHLGDKVRYLTYPTSDPTSKKMNKGTIVGFFGAGSGGDGYARATDWKGFYILIRPDRKGHFPIVGRTVGELWRARG